MKIVRPSRSAFTLIELLVVISIIGILATLAIPAVQKALVQGQMTGTLNNARQLHLATQMMSLDTANSGTGLSWTTEAGSDTAVGLNSYFEALTTNNYLSTSDLRKLLTAPGISPGAEATTFPADRIAFSVFQVSEQSPSDQPFVVTRNWGSTGLNANTAPYGNKGFVMFAKGGSGGVYNRPSDATSKTLFPTSSGDANATYSTTTLN